MILPARQQTTTRLRRSDEMIMLPTCATGGLRSYDGIIIRTKDSPRKFFFGYPESFDNKSLGSSATTLPLVGPTSATCRRQAFSLFTGYLHVSACREPVQARSFLTAGSRDHCVCTDSALMTELVLAYMNQHSRRILWLKG